MCYPKEAGRVKVKYTWCSASLWGNLATESLRYGTCCRGISQFYLHNYAFIHEWNEPYLPLVPSRSWSSFTDPEGMEGWVDIDTTTVSKQSAQVAFQTVTLHWLDSYTPRRSPIQVLTEPDVD